MPPLQIISLVQVADSNMWVQILDGTRPNQSLNRFPTKDELINVFQSFESLKLTLCAAAGSQFLVPITVLPDHVVTVSPEIVIRCKLKASLSEI